MRTLRTVAALWVALYASRGLYAQSAELSGFVKDPTTASIPKAKLELRNRDTGVRIRASTNEDGLYSFASLKPGTYDAIVQADGFRTLTRNGIGLNVGDRASLDFSMELGGVASSVTVNADASMTDINSTDSSVRTVVDQQFVDNMPLSGRSFQALIHLTPGVTITPSYQDAPGQFSVNGQRTNSNYFMIDGVSANFGATVGTALGQTISGSIPGWNILGGTNGLVSVDATQEFRIQTSGYAAEFGRSPGAQVSILTKSGSNQFHGTAYDYFRNDIFDARNWFNMVPEPKPPLRQNDFGGVLSGPIRKNHTFFLVSFEGLRLQQPDTNKGIFLTAKARALVPAIYRPFVDAFPVPTAPARSGRNTAPLTVSYSDPARFDATSFRVDHSSGGRLTLFARYSHSPSAQGQHNFAEFNNYTGNADTVTAGATLILSPNKANDFRANWSHWNGQSVATMQNLFGAVAPPESAIFPSFNDPANSLATFAMPFTSGELQEGTRSNNVQQQFNVVDAFSMTAGLHQLKFGVDFRRMDPTNAPLDYSYSTSPSSYATLLAGKTNLVVVGGSNPVTVRFFNSSLFAQDTWKVSQRVTLTYGLRWELDTGPVSTTAGKPLFALSGIFDSGAVGLMPTPLWNTRLNNLAPRIGAAWKLSPHSVVRGGFGLFYDLGYGAETPLAATFPYYRTTMVTNDPAIPFDLNSPAFTPLPFTMAIPPNARLQAINPHLDAPQTYQWNAAFEQSLGENQSLTATYLGAWGRNLLRNDLVVPAGSILAIQGGSAGITYNGGYSHYEALQLQFKRRLSRGLQALVSYTLGQSTDTSSTDVGLGASASYTQTLASSVGALRLPPLAPSDFDARNTLSGAVSWELPAPAMSGLHSLLKDWAFDGLVRAHSALPLNVLYQRFFPGGYYNVQPDVVPGQPFWIPDANQPEGRVVNPNAFAIPSGVNGDFPRNALRGFSFNQADVALRRRFALTERLKLDVRVEYFNVFNHPVFGNPCSLWGNGNNAPYALFGKVAPGNTLNVALGGGGVNGGQAAVYAPGGPRSAQFTLKLSF